MINKRYNGKQRVIIQLKEGEKFCPKCDGSGFVKGPTRFKLLTCNICLGSGTLDWIERARGKRLVRA